MKKLINTEIVTVPIGELRVHPKNARRGNVDKIVESIQEHGFHGVIVAQKSTGYILVGNHRYLAMKKAGYDEIRVEYIDVDDEASIKKMLADNKTSDDALYDEEELLKLLKDIPSLAGTGYDSGDVDDLLRGLHDGDGGFGDSQKSEGVHKRKSEDAFVEVGDVWEVDGHRIVCGDSTKSETYEQLFAGVDDRAVCIVTDPPYGVSYSGDDKTKRDVIINDDLQGQHLEEFIRQFLDAAITFANKRCSMYMWAPSGPQLINFLKAITSTRWKHRQTIVWNKNVHKMGAMGQAYHYKHEFCIVSAEDPEVCLYGWREDGVHDFYGGRKQSTVWDIDKPSTSDLHPTQKPLECMLRPIVHASKVGEIILDPFLGSGTTLIAADSADRKCYGIELDPVYASICVERIREKTGKKGKRLNG